MGLRLAKTTKPGANAGPGGSAKPGGAEQALRAVGVLHQLTLEAVLSKNTNELAFRILNRTNRLFAYDRAVLWEKQPKRFKLAGVSGQTEVHKESELAAHWRKLVNGLVEPDKGRVLSEKDFPQCLQADWQKLQARPEGAMVLWLPIKARGELMGGLLLERWGGNRWKSSELQLVYSLLVAYGEVWHKLKLGRNSWSRLGRRLRERRISAVLAVLLTLSMFIPVPLRVVAQCEVIAKDPWVVTAPLNGVVKEVVVRPGQKVFPGQLLLSYDKRAATEELQVANQQVQIIQSSLKRNRMQAFSDPRSRAEVKILEHRLEQELARLELAASNAAQLEIRSDVEGRVVIDEPHRWRGRPVAVGEMVMRVVDPGLTKLRIWLPEDDNLEFDIERPIEVVLNAMPDEAKEASLSYVAQSVGEKPTGEPAVEAEAEWISPQQNLRIGLQGVAVMYGEKVPLAYWLARKPIAFLRRNLGV